MSAKPSFRPKRHALEAIFGRRKVVIGMVHSRALPGSAAYDGESMDELVGFALAEAERLREGGVDGLIVENHGDIPFVKPDMIGPETAACMAVMTDAVRRATGLPVGVNALANAAHQALAVAKASGAAFIRVNQWANAYVSNEGLLDGTEQLTERLAGQGKGRRAAPVKLYGPGSAHHSDCRPGVGQAEAGQPGSQPRCSRHVHPDEVSGPWA